MSSEKSLSTVERVIADGSRALVVLVRGLVVLVNDGLLGLVAGLRGDASAVGRAVVGDGGVGAVLSGTHCCEKVGGGSVGRRLGFSLS